MENVLIPKTLYIKKYNFSANLPDDFKILLSLENNYGHIPCSSFIEQGRIDYFGRYKTENFVIKDNKILFSGYFSKYWIIRIFQRIFEWLNPSVYRLKYIPTK